MKMKDKETLRKEIDTLDIEIMKLLDQRFHLVKEIGKIKLLQNATIEDIHRENEILQKTDSFSSSASIRKVYQSIFNSSKLLEETTDYYLVGKKLTYSYSKLIHHLLGNLEYSTKEITSFSSFLNTENFHAINITNPFKHEAYTCCTLLSEEAQKTKIVNTIVKLQNQFIGYNTDYQAFLDMLNYYRLNLKKETIAIIGNGDTSKTVYTALQSIGIKNIFVFARHPHNNEYDLTEITQYDTISVIMNCTSYNVYPNLELIPLFNCKMFPLLKYILDVNYNPNRSIMAIVNPNIRYYNGLYMLIRQAKLTEEIIDQSFNRKRKNEWDEQKIYQHLIKKNLNIVLIGMPYSGKTTLAQTLAKELQKELYDMDVLLANDNLDLAKLIRLGFAEKEFRIAERNLTNQLALKTNAVIATGGGIIFYEENIHKLKANGIVIFLDPPYPTLISRFDKSRPLCQTETQLHSLYEKRQSIYSQHADYIIHSTDIHQQIHEIKEYITYAYFNIKRS